MKKTATRIMETVQQINSDLHCLLCVSITSIYKQNKLTMIAQKKENVSLLIKILTDASKAGSGNGRNARHVEFKYVKCNIRLDEWT